LLAFILSQMYSKLPIYMHLSIMPLHPEQTCQCKRNPHLNIWTNRWLQRGGAKL